MNWRVWVCRKPPPAPPRPALGLGLGGPAPRCPPPGQFRAVCKSPPPPTPCHPLSPTRAAHLPTGNWPVPPGPRGPRRRPAGLAGRLPTAPPAAAARGSSAAHRDRRHKGRGPQHASTVGPPAWPVASPSGPPASHAPAASGPPPQSTLQPGAVGPVASRLTIYSPTPVGWGNGEQALMCPKRVPGGALNYVSGPCRVFVPYKVGRLLSPETQFKRTWSRFAQFHVTWPPIPQPRPHRRRCCVTDGAPGRRPGRRPVGSGRPGRALPKPHQLVSFGCVEKWAPVNWRVWVCRKRRPAPPVNWSDCPPPTGEI